MKKTFTLILLFFACFSSLLAQDSTYARNIIKELSSNTYFGRGYLKDGCNKAADFLQNEMKEIGLSNFNNNYFQEFSYPVNTFPENEILMIDGKKFQPSLDYIIKPDCRSIEGNFKLVRIPDKTILDSAKLCKLKPAQFKNKVVVFNTDIIKDYKYKSFVKSLIRSNFLNATAYILVRDYYPIYSASTQKNDFAIIEFTAASFPKNPKNIYLYIKSEEKILNTKNIIGYIPNDNKKTIAFTAHYDHLGGIGDSIFFPGAQDNSSGVAMCLDIARYYKTNKGNFRVIIILFSGEESGLLGSTYYTENPLFPLDKIDIVINLDMVGTGEKGITIVNAKDSTYKNEWDLFQKINNDGNLLPDIKARGISANSDHFPFNRQGNKAVFIYSRGEGTYYHHVNDKSETVSLSYYEEIFQLITKFADSYAR